MNRTRNVVAAAIGLGLAVIVLSPSLALANATIHEQGQSGRARAKGSYYFVCQPTAPFPGTPKILFVQPTVPFLFVSIVLSPCGDGSWARMWAVYPAPGTVIASAKVFGAGGAGLVGKLPQVASVSDTLDDSLQVSVNRSTPGQVTLSISGIAKHLNPASTINGVRSRLRISVYPDTTSANNETGAIAFGEMTFTGTATTQFSGFFSSGDFTAPTPAGDGDFQVATVGGLTKVVSVPNEGTATVAVTADPEVLLPASGTPATTPLTAALLAMGLLGGAAWFVASRRREA